MGMVIKGVAAKVPLVTSQREALKASSVGVYLDGLLRIPFWVSVTVLGVGFRKAKSVKVREESFTPSWAILGMAT